MVENKTQIKSGMTTNANGIGKVSANIMCLNKIYLESYYFYL